MRLPCEGGGIGGTPAALRQEANSSNLAEV